MNSLAVRRLAGLTTLLVGVFLVAGVVPAAAIPQSNPEFPTVPCGGEWHWVHNQTEATSGTLTVVFQSAGTIQVANTPSSSEGLHYHITLATGDTLISASDDVAGGLLLLSHWPVCSSTSTSTSTTSPTSSSSTSSTTTSTTTSTTSSTSSTTSTTTTTTLATTQPTSTTATTTTTTVPPVVLGIQVTSTTAAVAPQTLPFTGVPAPVVGGLGLVLAGLGAALMAGARRREQRGEIVLTGWSSRI